MKYADNSLVSNPGSRWHTVYSPKVGQNGEINLVASGVEDIQEYINSFKESTDLGQIMARVAAGDTSALMSRPGSYGDFTAFPQTYAEVLQLQIDSRRIYDSLPVEVKRQFNNDPNQFLAQAGTESWFDTLKNVLPSEIMNMVKPPVADIQPVDPVKPVVEEGVIE